MVSDPFTRLPRYLSEVGVTATSQQLDQFRIHFDLLLRWNAKTNLTAVRNPDEVLRRHIAESAFLTKVVALGGGTLIDIGSGGGFPGIPAKILSPDTRVILVEAAQKKAAFLKEVARELKLPGLEVFAGRFEDLPSSGLSTLPDLPRRPPGLQAPSRHEASSSTWNICPVPGRA